MEEFCSRVVRIRSKQKQTIPLVFTPIQRKLHRARTGDDIVVKARQEGVTTYFVADALAKAILFENERRVIAFHKEEAAKAARRDILGFMWRHIDPDIRPITSQDSQAGLFFPD
ncbi:MAG: hypothetical protein GWO24_32880, partial [Akkermansiaceae bacterium]|nr:hypothetical protein [Akkermansiaceae bacterium]NIT78392.1 hypothetical protein [Thermoplasmata archaeon]NIY04761.1 hypothetical protein [Thermoplasmata archaeon]